MNVKTWLKQNKDVKKADIVLAMTLEKDPAWLVIHEDFEIDGQSQAKADELVAKLREGVPIEYLLGVAEFCGNWLKVTPEVLIPRLETELVVDLALEAARKINDRTPKILDIGTGSGGIAISVAKKMPNAWVYMTDISLEALKIAMFNALMNEVEIRTMAPTDLMRDFNPNRSYDVIVANLPYVDRNWKWIDESLKYEPEIALFAEDGGLALIKELIDQVAKRQVDKYLVLEADPCQHKSIVEYAESKGLKHLKTKGFGLLFRITPQSDV